MLRSTALLAALIGVVAGGIILWSNPRRAVNRVVCTCSLHWAAWLACLHVAAFLHGGLFWFRLSCAVGAWLPFHYWIAKEIIASSQKLWNWNTLFRSLVWIVVSAALMWICFTDYFVPSHSTELQRVRGWGYYAYITGYFALNGFILLRTSIDAKALTEGRRMELQVWLIGGCAVVVAILATMILNTATNDQVYIQLQPLLVLGFYASAAYAVTTHRLFDSAQILLIAVNKAALIAGATGVAYLVFIGSQQMLPTGLAFVPTTIAALLTAVTMQSWLDRWFKFFPQATKARQEAFAVAGRESRVENLEKGFVKILQGWGQTDNALVLVGNGGPVRALGAELTDDSAAMRTLRQLRWISPERLAREKTSAERQILAKILSDNRLGVMAVGQNPTLGVVVSVGVPATYRPYTYPQVMQLMELISIFEGAFERAYLTAKMQHAEQLATVGLLGASLAHEIRNPLVSIKTFVQLLPSRYQDAAFRDKFFRLMTDEVARIDRLTEQLLELASPRAYVSEVIELHPVLRASLDLVAPKAAIRHVQILTDLQAVPDKAYIDASAVKQVLLNLCFNAIQALENRDGNDWIKVTTRRVQDHIEIAVSDSGPGIAPEMQTRLFQPFQSTKSTGFGLGLAICRDILVGLNASIAVDPPTNGGGATFRVTIPCQPS